MTLWFDSNLDLIQLLINRIPTGWFKIRGYVFDALKAPDVNKLDSSAVNDILELFETLKDKEFPAIWIQLARNITKDDIHHD